MRGLHERSEPPPEQRRGVLHSTAQHSTGTAQHRGRWRACLPCLPACRPTLLSVRRQPERLCNITRACNAHARWRLSAPPRRACFASGKRETSSPAFSFSSLCAAGRRLEHTVSAASHRASTEQVPLPRGRDGGRKDVAALTRSPPFPQAQRLRAGYRQVPVDWPPHPYRLAQGLSR